MKFAIFIATTLFLLSTIQAKDLNDEQKKALQDLREFCLNKTKLPMDKLITFSQHKYDDNDDNIKQYVLCYFQTMGAIDANGNYQKDLIRTKLNELIGENVANEILSKCLYEDSSVVEKAWKYGKCGHRYWPANYPAY